MKTLLTLLMLIFIAAYGFSQDVIYTRDGKKTEVKILEIKPGEIRYKKMSNPDGPDYVILKSQVLLITYANDTFESFGTRTSAKIRPLDTVATTYGKNFIAYNTFDLLLTNLTFSYERIIASGMLGLRIPLSIGFGNGNSNGYFNANVSGGTIMASGLDLNIYPSGQGKTRYFIAPSFLITSFNYTFYDYSSSFNNTYETRVGHQYAVVIKHGILMQITPHFNMSCVLGLGLSQNDTDYDDNTNTKATLEFNVGYKF